LASDDPECEHKTADIIGLYLRPPQHAAVFCVDEKTAIQALDRLDPVLPLSPGRAERHGFEYYRHGTLSPGQQIHIILDNLSAHKTQLVRDFLQQHPNVQLHFTPTYSAWLNQSRSGSPRSNARSSPAAFSPRSRIAIGQLWISRSHSRLCF
jgi:DDE superfamily endonuclease